MNVLSLFDGMSCGQQALERAGIKVDNYFASEIDKYAIKVTMANYPNTIQLGSVVDVDGYSLPKIDLLIGGSPCQSFSFAGKRKGMSTKDNIEILTLEHYLELKEQQYEFEGQSYLFWEFMRLLKEVKPKYFLLENVEMGEKWEKVLSKAIGVNGIHINSSLVSAQNRSRIYWTNIGMKPMGLFGDMESIIKQPKDKGILLKDILQDEVDEKYFLSERQIESISSWKAQQNPLKGIETNHRKNGYLTARGNDDLHSGVKLVLEKKASKKVKQVNQSKESGGKQPYQQNRIYDINGISPALMQGKSDLLITDKIDTGNTKDIEIKELNENQLKKFNPNVNANKANTLTLAQGRAGSSGEYMDSVSKIAKITSKIRRLTPIECERLQTIKDNYSNHVSDSQRYKMLGNGWTVDVIAHIFSYINL